MKILLDENLPRKLKLLLGNHEVFTVKEMGWSSTTNGELLALLQTNKFDALLTSDKNLRFQQPLEKYRTVVIVLLAENNRLHTLKPLVPKILSALNFLKPGQTYEVSL